MNILAIDTATAILSAALSSPRGIHYIEADAGLRHSECLMELIDRIMALAGLEAAGLEAVACMKGPGSFTGLRIGFAAAKGLAFSLSIPLLSVPTLDCMAAPFSFWEGIVLPVMDAKKHHFFTALYDGSKRISDYMDAGVPEIAEQLPKERPILLTGPDAPMLKPLLKGYVNEVYLFEDPSYRHGKGRELLEIVSKDAIFYYKQDVETAGPLYLRKSDAELSLKDQEK
ncbi:tRNA (adenosine(37)-N6)-threonylcarbamoyltransferase complex dimerization subunit type 1 TsaB [Treponema sp. OttesenSCG-928-L16]|nr:tRNA (adenosine(37)-N6)-threonylcarbamoyltransferase complex dimerization subunit type 1 TsaB [Treponema sp. OttesenSCG-928-L16]